MVTIMSIGVILAPCVLPLAAMSAVDGIVGQYMLRTTDPNISVDVSIITSSIIGLALPATLLYYTLAILICRFVFEKKVGVDLKGLLPITLSTGYLLFTAIVATVILVAYIIVGDFINYQK